MPQRPLTRKRKPERVKQPPSRYAPAAFLKASPAGVQALCDSLATLAAARFGDLTGTTWQSAGQALAQQLRALGHDLMSLDESAELQEYFGRSDVESRRRELHRAPLIAPPFQPS